MPSYVHNPYLDGGAYGNTVDSNRVGTSALTIGLAPPGAASGGNPLPIGLAPNPNPYAGGDSGGGSSGGGRNGPGVRPS